MTADGADSRIAPSARRALRCRTVVEGGFRQLNYVRGLQSLEVEEQWGRPDDAPVATRPETLLGASSSAQPRRVAHTARRIVAAGTIRKATLASPPGE